MVAIKKITPKGTIREGYQRTVYHYSNSLRARNRKTKKEEADYTNTPKNMDNFFLSPFYPAQFVHHGIRFKSAIQYVQYKKHRKCPTYQSFIMNTDTPIEAMILGKAKYIPNANKNEAFSALNQIILSHKEEHQQPEDWENERDTHFVNATYQKFRQNPLLKEALLDTYPHPIVEDTLDPYWGKGRRRKDGTYTGLNMAGRHLTYVRDLFIKKALESLKSNDNKLELT